MLEYAASQMNPSYGFLGYELDNKNGVNPFQDREKGDGAGKTSKIFNSG